MKPVNPVFRVQCSVRRGSEPTFSVPFGHSCTRHSSHAARHGGGRCAAAFTLMELMVVVAVIAILASISIATLGYVNRKGAESRAKTEVATLSAAIDNYRLEVGNYPTNQAALYSNLVTTNNPLQKIYFEPPSGMVSGTIFIDPWGNPYQYRTGAGATNNPGFFDLWSTSGNTNESNATNWIRN